MNVLVLVVAGVFVLAGAMLIVLSIVLYRNHPDKGEEAPPVDEPPEGEPQGAFIDEPLQSDFLLDLGPLVSPPSETNVADAPNNAIAEPIAPSIESAESTVDSASTGLVLPPGEEPTPPTEAEPTPPAAAEPTPPKAVDPDMRQISYSFRMVVAADHVLHGRLRDAISEYEKAMALTDDREMRSYLLVETGNAWRELDERESAARAYEEAAAQTANEGLRAHLRRSADDMRRSVAPQTGEDPADGQVDGEREQR
jgi:hypothetical protein